MPLTGTVIELLTARNPTLDLSRQPPGPVSQSPLYEKLLVDQVVDWPDFTYANLQAAFGHLFSIGPITAAVQDMRGTPSEIEREAHVDDLTILWNYQICREPMKRAANRIQSDLNVPRHDVSMKHRGQNSKNPGSDSKAKAPDWCIFLRDDNYTTVVWADSKCSSKWSSQKSMDIANWIWPFRQLLTYCVNNSTRYGYILTPEEIVVVRIFEDRSIPGFVWRVQHAAIPWSNAGPDILTVNLSIWALAMMSLNEGHRPIRKYGDMLPLNAWYKCRDTSKRTYYEHHLSGHRLLELPAGAQVVPEAKHEGRSS